MSRGVRVGIAGAFFAVAVGLVVFAVMGWLRSEPATVDFTQGHQSGQPVDMTIQTVGAIGSGPHPSWVSYLVQDPSGNWVHTTLWQLPAHTRVNVTVEEFDSGSPLRNQAKGVVEGTIGNVEEINGKATSLVDSNVGNGVAHTFSVPEIGLNVPLYAVNSSANICSGAPCSFKGNAYNIIKFSFTTPGDGQYRWQCFVPCGLGFLFGNGGPMSTVGYMGGFLKVVD